MKLVKVGWEYILTVKAEEKRTRGGRVYDRSGVYKISMVSMIHDKESIWRISECKGLNN